MTLFSQRHSFAGKIVLWAFSLALLATACAIGIYVVTASTWFTFGLTALVTGVVTVWSSRVLLANTQNTLRTLADGIRSFQDRDFTVSIRQTTNDELGDVVAAYNDLGKQLRSERQNLYQRELLLDTVIQATPVALVLTNARDIVLYGNVAARQLLHENRRIEGMKLSAILESSTPALQEAVASAADALFTMEVAGEPEIFHVSQRKFVLNAQNHRLLLLKQLTREINAQEVATWKKVIRVLAHEINNSLAPISSLMHSGKHLLQSGEIEQLARVFETVEDRVNHLQGFINGYARFAKLPKPRTALVAWSEFFESLRRAVPFKLEDPLPSGSGTFDAAQISQAVINIVRNALEAGSPAEEITLMVRANGLGAYIEVRDRGSGMSENVLQSAVLPFYSTKPSGTGLGLALCREIVEAHRGRIHLANRADGGAIVSLWLPQASQAAQATASAFNGDSRA